MKERLQHLLSEAGESFDYLRSDIRNISRYLAELEELIERYRVFAVNATLSTPTDRAEIRKLLKKTHKILGPLPNKQAESSSTDASNGSAMVEAFRQGNSFTPTSLDVPRCD